MRNMVRKKIMGEWSVWREEGFQSACNSMGWSCEQDFDYEKHGPTLFAVRLPNSEDLYIVEQGTVNEDFEIVLYAMSDEALLEFWESQLCLKYR